MNLTMRRRTATTPDQPRGRSPEHSAQLGADLSVAQLANALETLSPSLAEARNGGHRSGEAIDAFWMRTVRKSGDAERLCRSSMISMMGAGRRWICDFDRRRGPPVARGWQLVLLS